MCGITGFFSNKTEFNPTLFARANNIITHRGPDDYGYLVLDKNFNTQAYRDETLTDCDKSDIIGAFGFRRLSIIDLSPTGHQPMVDSSGNFWIIFNGEIYNYIELREELKLKGYSFATSTDTEVILNAYKEWGNACLSRFNGMWAFCILDKKSRKLFCARDRAGVKPFYYTTINNCFAFGSEMKQLLALFPNQLNSINQRLIFDFLVLGSYGNESPETYFNGVFKLSPGTFSEVDLTNISSNIKEVKWWDLPEVNYDMSLKDEDVFQTIYGLLEDSIRIRLRSDVPVGTALSGGLDSSGIVSLVGRITGGDPEKNKVFNISTNDKSIQDPYYADLLIKSTQVACYKKNFENAIDLNELPKFIWHQEEPLQNTTILGSWHLYRFIKEKGVTVALDGQGADEFMGGYHRWPFRMYLIDLLKNGDYGFFNDQISKLSNIYKVNKLNIYRNLFYALIINYSKSNFKLFYREKYKNLQPFFMEDFYNTQFKNSMLINKSFNNTEIRFNSDIKRDSYNLIKHTNLPGILRQVDRNSMAFSVESRLPFLDYRLMEFLFSLPEPFMIRNGFTKYSYRMAMRESLPEEIVWRKNKEGFKMPEYSILKENKKFIQENLQLLRDDNFVNFDYLNSSLNNILQQKTTYNSILWRLLTYAIWKKTFSI